MFTSIASLPTSISLAEASTLHTIFSWFSDPLFILVMGLFLLAMFFWYLSSDNDRIKRNAGTVFILGITIFSLSSLLSKGIRYGIDISGGVSFALQIKPNIDEETGQPIPLSQEAREQACGTIMERLNASGANEVTVMPQGDDKIMVNIPEIDPERIKEQRELITRIAKLELRVVHTDSDSLVARGVELVSGYSPFDYIYEHNNGKKSTTKIYLERTASFTGKDIVGAHPDYATPGIVNVSLNTSAASLMWNITSNMKKGHDRIAIVLDGVVKSAPVVQGSFSKDFQISGLNAPGEATQLARTLANPLSNELIVLEERQVSASLGKTALQQGELAGIVGLIICFFLVTIYYRFAGMVAIVGLCINALILLGAMSLFGFVLTLPGIAGIVLTLGVAVDANVLIYERLREEQGSGKPFRISLRNAYDKAFSAIFDSNVTSLITAIILFWMASGTVKGFAVTLTVGIASSMIGAIVVTRVLFYWADRIGMLKDMKFLNIFGKMANYNFLNKRALAACISGALLLFTLIVAGIKGKQCLGIDFTGGTSITYELPKDAELDFKKVEHSVNGLKLSQVATVQEFNNAGGDTNIIVRCSAEKQDRDIITSSIAKNFPILIKEADPNIDMVGPLLGAEFLRYSMWALLSGMLGIMAYLTVRYEWSFALGAVIAILHDVILVIGTVIILGGQLSIIHVGAILTIAGYSINDTIIIFDRIREHMRFADPDEPEADIMNNAVNSTLSRTLLTSGATLATVICLYFFGGPAMQDFSLTILLGIIIGTYSSIYIAAPCVLLFSRKHGLRAEVEHTIKSSLG